MRADFKFGLLLAIAGVPLAVAIMAAPLYFHLDRYAGYFFWGGIGLFVLVLIAAIAIAVRDEESAKNRGERRPVLAIVGMVVFGCGFLGCAAWYFWPTPAAVITAASKRVGEATKPHKEPPPVDAPIPRARPEPPPTAQVPPHAEAREIEPGKDNSRLSVSRLAFVPTAAGGAGHQELRIYYRNRGSILAVAPATAANWLYADNDPPDVVINNLTEVVARAAYSPAIFDESRPELDTDQEAWRAPGVVLSDADLQPIKDGKKSLTIFFAMAYMDASLKAHQYWQLTYTAVFKGSLTEWAILRSRTVLKEAPK